MVGDSGSGVSEGRKAKRIQKLGKYEDWAIDMWRVKILGFLH